MKAKPLRKRPSKWMGGALALAMVLPFMSPSTLRGADSRGDSVPSKHSHSGKVSKSRVRENDREGESAKENALALAKAKAHQAEVDMNITNAVKDNILFHFLLNTKVDTSNGVVTLTGVAGTDDEKSLNTKLAGKIAGVKKVVNLMDVSSTMVTSN